MFRKPLFGALLLSGCALASCTVEVVDSGPDIIDGPHHHEFPVPANLGDHIPEAWDNPITDEGVALGRHLFYDPMMSANGEVACATCHMQEQAFGDSDVKSSAGVSGQELKRHTPALINIAWYQNGLFWDGSAVNLEELNLIPLQHADEMARDLDALIAELNEHDDYKAMFDAAFPGEPISPENLSKALAQFQRTFVSGNSKYDKWLRGEGNVQLSELELQGRDIFFDNCDLCHTAGFFSDFYYHNIGLDAEFPDEASKGRGAVDGEDWLTGAYKTPTLRNVSVTAPYMHDGRFATLDEVIDFYSEGIEHNPWLDHYFQEKIGVKKGLDFTDTEKAALKAFMLSLTDNEFLANEAYSTPF